jgi:hypothetical protein
VILPPIGRKEVVANPRVTLTAVLPATRSALAIDKKTAVTCDDCAVAELITPDDTPADATQSVSVCTVMPVALPAVAAPIVTPLRVMVKAVLAAMPTTAVVMTMEVAPGTLAIAVMTATEVVPAKLGMGVAGAKNPAGKFMVIFPPIGREEVVVNPRVMLIAVLPATRSALAIDKETEVTCV